MNTRLQSLALVASLLHRFSLRYWLRHWPKLALLVAIVALGVGSFLAIGLANRAALASFDSFAQTVSGQSQIVVTSAAGALSVADAKALRIALLDTEAALFPHLVANARFLRPGDDPFNSPVFTLIGADLMAASNFLVREQATASFWDSASNANNSPGSRPLGFYSQASTADTFGWVKDQSYPFVLNDQIHQLPWLGPLPQLPEAEETASRVLVIDWKQLQSMLARPGQLDRIDIAFPRRSSASSILDTAALIRAANPGHWIIETAAERQRTGATMTQALRMNLRALSVLSLCVAVCLVFQAMDSAVARRQSEVSTLRSLGLSPGITKALWLTDAALIGALGGAAGTALGLLMARFSTALVSQTVATLYHRTGGGAPLQVSGSEIALAWSLALVACLAAGWWPARQAARAPLAETISQGNHRSSYSRSRYALAAAAFLVLSIAAYLVPPLRAANGHAIPVGGYALALALIGAVACLGCLCLDALGLFAGPACRRSPSLRLALSQFRQPVTRHRLALAGVTISIGMTAAMVFLIGSFESTVRSWIGATLQADLFLRSRAVASIHDESRLDPAILQALRNDPRIADSAAVAASPVRIENLPTQLLGYDTAYLDRVQHFTWLDRPANLLDLANGQNAVVNESFASRFQKSVGDQIAFNSAQAGPVSLRIIGIYADYGNEGGSLGVDLQRYAALTGDTQFRAFALHAADPSQIERLQRDIESAYPALNVATNRWVREETLRIFKRVFSITYALEILGLVISVAGLGSMLASLLIERRSEISALQRLGVSPSQIARSSLWEGLALAALGTVSGLALGGALGLVLIYIINKQSFGWTLAANLPIAELAGLVVLALAGAAIVSYFVGRWASRLPILHEE